jgi:hypothetical protein
MLPMADLQPMPDMPQPIKEAKLTMQGDMPVWFVNYEDGTMGRIDARSGTMLPGIDEAAAKAIVAKRIAGGDKVESATLFSAKDAPFDFRRPMPAWQIALEDGTHVYVGEQTGNIEAVRTQYWRLFDFMWGLHIMDLQTREDTSHPILILFAALGVIGSVLGCILMFRRRKARVSA